MSEFRFYDAWLLNSPRKRIILTKLEDKKKELD